LTMADLKDMKKWHLLLWVLIHQQLLSKYTTTVAGATNAGCKTNDIGKFI
jgi:methylglyoxal synthase